MTNRKTEIDWSLTTWEGSRREQLRRWCKLSLRERLRAVEEMADLARHFADMREQGRFRDLSKIPDGSATGVPGKEKVRKSHTSGEEESRPTTGTVQEQHGDYDSKADGSNKPNNRGGNDS